MPEGEIFSPGSCLLTRAGRGAGGRSRAYRTGRRKRAGTLIDSAQHLARGIDVVVAPDEERSALMQLGGLNVEDPLMTVGCGTARLLDDEGERTGFVEETKLAALVPAIGGIREETAPEEISMEIRYQRADVPRAHRLPIAILSTVRVPEVLFVRLPLDMVGVVDGQIASDVGRPDVGMREEKLTQRRIERKAMRTLARRIHEHRARSVDDVARRHLSPSRLQHVLHFAAAAASDLPNNREDRAHGDIDVDVRRAVERIEKKAILSAAKVGRDVDDSRLFLGSHGAEAPTMIDSLDDDLVRQDVELLLCLALNVLEVGRAEYVRQSCASHLVGDHLGGEGKIVQQARELARRFGMQLLLLDDKTLDRYD